MSTPRKFVSRGGSLNMQVILNGSPSTFSPANNEAYFIFNSLTDDFELAVSDIPAFIDELQGLYDAANAYEVEDGEAETVVSEPTPERTYMEVLERHSDAMEELAHQMSVFPSSSLDDLTEAIKSLHTINDMTGSNNRW